MTIEAPPRVHPPRASGSRRAWVLIVAVVASIALLVWLVAFSPVLGVRSVQVNGAKALTATQIEAAAAVPHGRPLLRVSTSAIEKRVEKLPQVGTATVSVSYPSTVVITVSERIAVGFFSTGGRYTLVDRTGRQFLTVAKAPKLPHLVAAGAAIDDPATVQTLATIAGALTPGLRRIVTTVNANDAQHVTLLLTAQRTVVWGNADRSADKVKVLTALLHRKGQAFDVSDPDLVVAR